MTIKTEEEIRKEAAAALGAKGGRAGTGDKKKRSAGLYKRLARIKQVEKAIRTCTDEKKLIGLREQFRALKASFKKTKF